MAHWCIWLFVSICQQWQTGDLTRVYPATHLVKAGRVSSNPVNLKRTSGWDNAWMLCTNYSYNKVFFYFERYSAFPTGILRNWVQRRSQYKSQGLGDLSKQKELAFTRFLPNDFLFNILVYWLEDKYGNFSGRCLKSSVYECYCPTNKKFFLCLYIQYCTIYLLF